MIQFTHHTSFMIHFTFHITIGIKLGNAGDVMIHEASKKTAFNILAQQLESIQPICKHLQTKLNFPKSL